MLNDSEPKPLLPCPFCGEIPKPIPTHVGPAGIKYGSWGIRHVCFAGYGEIILTPTCSRADLHDRWNARMAVALDPAVPVTESKDPVLHVYRSGICPRCGWQAHDAKANLIERSDPTHNQFKNELSDTEALDWVEKWRCPQCLTVFSFPNSNV